VTGVTGTESRVLEAIDLDGLLETLREWIAIPSVGGAETPCQRRVAGFMRDIGLDVDVWQIDLDRLGRHPAFSAEIERDEALGVVGRLGGERGPALVLNGHVDVVPAGERDRWTRPPWVGTIEEGRVYGRGSADMKGGLCCALFAIRAVREAGVALDGRVVVHSVVGEEDGGLGTLAAIERGHGGDGAIVLEPTGCVVAPAQAGALNFRLTVPGRAAHGALRAEGIDPIDRAIPLYRALQDLERRRNERLVHPLFASYEIPFALCVGTVRGGEWASTVAESVTLEGRLGVGIDEDPDDARREMAEAIGEAAAGDPWLREHSPTLEWWGGQFLPAAIAVDDPLVTTVSDAYRDVAGSPPEIAGMPYGADMRLLVREANVPTVLFGPGDVRRAHAPDEFVPVADLEAVTRTLALAILRFCGVREDGA